MRREKLGCADRRGGRFAGADSAGPRAPPDHPRFLLVACVRHGGQGPAATLDHEVTVEMEGCWAASEAAANPEGPGPWTTAWPSHAREDLPTSSGFHGSNNASALKPP